ncbi:DUF7344 domain-containing protein [Halopelagius longus]|nr:hypothetical protein [Halopelagius longus]SDQ74279.1 hypothetical protein SAMN05216278_2349 [Halopelagius longus]
MNCGSAPRVDDRFAAFADISRRIVLYTLYERSESGDPSKASIETLAEELASDGGREELADGGVPERPASPADAEIELAHVHIPGLERAGLVESDGDEVRLAVEPEVVEHGLELAEKFERAG